MPTTTPAKYTHPAIVALRPEWVATATPVKLLSALGHPGYGAKFAGQVIDRMERTGMSSHMAVSYALDALVLRTA